MAKLILFIYINFLAMSNFCVRARTISVDCEVCKQNFCTFKNVFITEPDTNVQCIKKPNINLDNIHTIKFEDSSIIFFPIMADEFDEIRHIYIIKANLTRVTKKDLQRYPKLYRLALQNNDITSLEENLFENFPELKIINLNDNKIEFIDFNAFDGDLKKLDTLRLLNNVCVDYEVLDSLKSAKMFVDALKFKCSKMAENCEDEKDSLYSTVYLSLAFNFIQVFILFAAIGGILLMFLKSKKSNSIYSTTVTTVENNYQDPNDLADYGSGHNYAEPVGTPSRPATMNKTAKKNFNQGIQMKNIENYQNLADIRGDDEYQNPVDLSIQIGNQKVIDVYAAVNKKK